MNIKNFKLPKQVATQELIEDKRTGARLVALGADLDLMDTAGLLDELDNLLFNYGRFEFGRQTAWFGTEGLNYHYAGKDHIATTPPQVIQDLADIARELVNKLGVAPLENRYNHILLNGYYKDQKLNYHRDDEPELLGSIFSMSFGRSGHFNFYNPDDPENTHRTLVLDHGACLLGNRAFFKRYLHSADSPLDPSAPRFNLTFRTIAQ